MARWIEPTDMHLKAVIIDDISQFILTIRFDYNITYIDCNNPISFEFDFIDPNQNNSMNVTKA